MAQALISPGENGILEDDSQRACCSGAAIEKPGEILLARWMQARPLTMRPRACLANLRVTGLVQNLKGFQDASNRNFVQKNMGRSKWMWPSSALDLLTWFLAETLVLA